MRYQFHRMKKIIFLFYLLIGSAVLFAQTPDSLAYMEEMQRIQKVGDSLNRLQIAKDSLSLEKIMAIQKGQNAGEENESEAEKRFNKVMQQQDKEQHILRNRLLILVAFFLILLFSMRAILNRQKRRRLQNGSKQEVKIQK